MIQYQDGAELLSVEESSNSHLTTPDMRGK